MIRLSHAYSFCTLKGKGSHNRSSQWAIIKRISLMTNNKQIHVQEMDMLTKEIIDDTIRNLLEENDGTFDLSTSKGIQFAIDYMVDYLMINKIEVESNTLKADLIRHLPQSKV